MFGFFRFLLRFLFLFRRIGLSRVGVVAHVGILALGGFVVLTVRAEGDGLARGGAGGGGTRGRGGGRGRQRSGLRGGHPQGLVLLLFHCFLDLRAHVRYVHARWDFRWNGTEKICCRSRFNLKTATTYPSVSENEGMETFVN